MLADVHKGKWSAHIAARIDSLSPALRDKVKVCMNVLNDRHRLVRHPKCMDSDPRTDQDWLNLICESHDRIPFHAIILSQMLNENTSRECDAFVEFLEALESERWQVLQKRTLSLFRCRDEYRTALGPILRHAKALSLIDPYMNSQESRFYDTISICSNLLGQRGHTRLRGRIDIHVEAGKQMPAGATMTAHFDLWERRLRPLIDANDHRFRVFLWESLPGSGTMHDRYILTDQCGISIPGGLDCRAHSHPNSTDWSLLDEDVRLRRWSDYDPQVSPFRLRDQREIK